MAWLNGSTADRTPSQLEAAIRAGYAMFLASDAQWSGGAKFDGVTNDTAAINACIDACSAAGGGVVWLPYGTAIVTGVILKSNVTLVGQGFNSTKLYLANGSNTDVIANYQSPDGIIANAQRVGVANLYIDGNKANQSQGNGIFYDCNPGSTKATNDVWFDPHNFVRDVYITGCKQTGVWAHGRSEMRFDNVVMNRCDQYGMRIPYDSFVKSCTASYAGLTGFYCIETNAKLTDCKAFLCGQITPASGHGFRLYNSTGSQIVNCIAQDNAGSGFALETFYGGQVVGCTADSNSFGSAGSFPGFDLFDVHNSTIIGVTTDRKNDGVNTYQTKSVQLRNVSDNNYIDIRNYGYNGAAMSAAPIRSTPSTGNGTELRLNGMQTNPVEILAYAAAITPNPFNGWSKRIGVLTGTITINAPANTPHPDGALLRFTFVEDGTGGATRNITWNAIYKGVTLAASGTANQRASITFEYDIANTIWIQVAVSAWA